MKQLITYKYSIKDYIKYLQSNKYNAVKLLQSDDIYVTLPYLLEYLSTKDLILIVDNTSFIIKTNIQRIKQDVKNNILIRESLTYNSIMKNYIIAIDKAMAYINDEIECPF